jgi:hypothetical protein
MLVNDICQWLDLYKSLECMVVEMICDVLLRWFQVGIESGLHGSSHRIRTGNWA